MARGEVVQDLGRVHAKALIERVKPHSEYRYRTRPPLLEFIGPVVDSET